MNPPTLAQKIRDSLVYRYPALGAFEAKIVTEAIQEVLDAHAIVPKGDAVDEAWKDWLAYRSERKLKAYTKMGEKAQLTRIRQWGEKRALEAIQYSMAQNYQGIFEDISTKQPGRGKAYFA